MKKTLRRFSALLAALLLCLAVLPVSAAAQEAIAVRVPVRLFITGRAPSEAREYTFRLTALNDAPMPALADGQTQAVDDEGRAVSELTITISGVGDAEEAWEIPVGRVGEYSYKVEQIRGNYSRCSYDVTVFYVKLTVYNSADGLSFEYQLATRKDEEMTGEKTKLEFTNHYRSPSSRPDPTPGKKDPDKTDLAVDKVWSGSGKNRPGSVTIELRDGETVVDTVTLGEWNNWHYSWNDLDESVKRDWNVKELEVPEGYSVSYSFDGTTFTVRNTEKLIQTGQLNWPVPVLALCGLALVAAGLLMLRKKKESGNA